MNKVRPLSELEKRMLQLAADGNTSADIARLRGHEEAIDNTHSSCSNVRRLWRDAEMKLGADNITHAVALAIRRGIIT